MLSKRRLRGGEKSRSLTFFTVPRLLERQIAISAMFVVESPSTDVFQYTGRENDANGLYFYRARYYNPAFARFISEDPIGFMAGTNFYAYARNNPISGTDPLGLKTCENCTSAAPLSANSPRCNSYGAETYFGTSLGCFCKCAGDGAWSQQVRGCDLPPISDHVRIRQHCCDLSPVGAGMGEREGQGTASESLASRSAG